MKPQIRTRDDRAVDRTVGITLQRDSRGRFLKSPSTNRPTPRLKTRKKDSAKEFCKRVLSAKSFVNDDAALIIRTDVYTHQRNGSRKFQYSLYHHAENFSINPTKDGVEIGNEITLKGNKQ